MFDELDQQMARDDDPSEKKDRWFRYAGAAVVALVILAFMGWAMGQYK